MTPRLTVQRGAQRSAQRRGAALLVALVCLSVVSLAGVSLLRLAFDASMTARRDAAVREAETLAADAENIALAWLASGAGAGTSGAGGGGFGAIPDGVDRSGFVRIASLHDDALTLTIDAIDLSGRLHVSHLRDHPRLRAALPLAYQGLDDASLQRLATTARPAARAGRLAAAADPAPLLREIVAMTGRADAREFSPLGEVTAAGSLGESACEWLTTRGGAPHALNVNTAPLQLLEAALAGRDPAAAARALAARQEGKPVPPDARAALALTRGRSGEALVPLSSSSSTAGFLVTVRIHSTTTRWWIVAEPAPGSRTSGGGAGASGGGGGGGWLVVERRRAEG